MLLRIAAIININPTAENWRSGPEFLNPMKIISKI